MDCSAAIEENREALKRVLAMLVAMAGLDASALTSPQGGGRREASGGGSDAADTPTRRSDDRRPPHKGEVKPEFTLPRHLHRAILRLLRPAEAAVRRLIIVVARGIVVALPPAYQRKPKPASTILRNGIGTGIVMPRGLRPLAGTRATRTFALPLFDRLPRWGAPPRQPAASGFPRISIPGLTQPCPVPRAPLPDDPIDAGRLALRLAALASALDDLPREARRFARWRARAVDAARNAAGAHKGNGRDAAGAQIGNSAVRRFRRVWPLRPGKPPGGRLSRYDPDARRRKNIRDVDEILAHAHALALYALSPDTS
jgi:hypothetical protein